MAIKSGIFNSVGGDRIYKAEDFAAYFASFIGNGVFPNPSNGFQLVAGAGMSVNLKAGKAWINGYYATNDGDYNLQLDVADGVLNRIDRVVLQLNYLNRTIMPVVKKGIFASTPAAPAIKRDADAYEIALADIRINKGALSISQANITDLRLNKELCGIVHGVVDQVDTTTIFNQYQAWFNDVTSSVEGEIDAWQMAQQQEFDDWFQSIQNILDGDVAANLAVQINDVDRRLASHNNEDGTLVKKGHVQLSSSVTSASETLAATPKAVKTAMDRADAAFQTGNNVKVNMVDALLSVDPSLPINHSSTWSEIMGVAGRISTGFKKATGNFTPSGQFAVTTINNLTFTPSFVIVKNSVKNSGQGIFIMDNTGLIQHSDNVLWVPNTNQTLTSDTRATLGVNIIPNGFKHYAYYTGVHSFIAIE